MVNISRRRSSARDWMYGVKEGVEDGFLVMPVSALVQSIWPYVQWGRFKRFFVRKNIHPCHWCLFAEAYLPANRSGSTKIWQIKAKRFAGPLRLGVLSVKAIVSWRVKAIMGWSAKAQWKLSTGSNHYNFKCSVERCNHEHVMRTRSRSISVGVCSIERLDSSSHY